MKHFRYLSYVLRHKWFVMLACFSEGLYWRGLVHDWHKFLPSEWFSYVEHFYGKPREPYVDKYILKTRRALYWSRFRRWLDHYLQFDLAWLKHQNRADHHWQWWMLTNDEEEPKLLSMSHKALLEMLCDWKGASRAQGHGGSWSDVTEWWKKNEHRIQVASETNRAIYRYLMLLREGKKL